MSRLYLLQLSFIGVIFFKPTSHRDCTLFFSRVQFLFKIVRRKSSQYELYDHSYPSLKEHSCASCIHTPLSKFVILVVWFYYCNYVTLKKLSNLFIQYCFSVVMKLLWPQNTPGRTGLPLLVRNNYELVSRLGYFCRPPDSLHMLTYDKSKSYFFS